MAGQDDFDEEDLEVAATRPPLIPVVGIPLGLGLVYLMGAFAIANIFHQTVFGIGAAVILTFFSSLLMRRDYNGVRIFGIWCRLCAQWLSARKMHGMTVSHFPMRQDRRAAPRGVWRDVDV